MGAGILQLAAGRFASPSLAGTAGAFAAGGYGADAGGSGSGGGGAPTCLAVLMPRKLAVLRFEAHGQGLRVGVGSCQPLLLRGLLSERRGAHWFPPMHATSQSRYPSHTHTFS